MIVADLTDAQLALALRDEGLRVRTGPVITSLRSRLTSIRDGIRLHYAWHAIAGSDEFADFHVEVEPEQGARRWLRPQAAFRFEGGIPFNTLPLAQAYPMLEWGLNWCVSHHCHQFLIVHAAVVERRGSVVVLPAPPGSGKSTLCAALMLEGWRLFSDELALLSPSTLELHPLARPVSLKNASIAVIRTFSERASIGAEVHDTNKGTVAHLRPSEDSVRNSDRAAPATVVVFPRYRAGAEGALVPLSRADAFMRIVANAFNYDIHARSGFETLAGMIDRCDCFEFEYASLDSAMATFDRLAA